MTITEETTENKPAAVPQKRRNAWVRALGVSGIIAAVVLLLITLIAILAPWVAPYDPTKVDILRTFQPPSGAHPLGTDSSGRDLLSRLMMGARTTLAGAAMVAVLAGLLGTAMGMFSGWYGGVVDSVLSRIMDLLFAFPGILLALVVVALFPPSLVTAAIALAISIAPFLARIVRGEVIRQRSEPYIQALIIQGLSTPRLWFRHLLPNISALVIAQVTVIFGYAMVGLATLSYLGLGVQPPTPDWGRMVADGQSRIQQGHPAESLLASLLIAITVVAVTVLGDRLTTYLTRENR